MPNWNEILDEIRVSGSTFDITRKKYLTALQKITGRNTIAYYSGWLQKPEIKGSSVDDADKNGFMSVIHKLDRSQGLDLILHTPGGETAATESLVDYLRSMFGTDIRAIVPQLALSAGTMIACACKEIIMGKHSSLGPIDPQIGGVPAHGILEEFKRAHREVKADNTKAFVWQPIVARYSPTLIGECEKAVTWSETMVKNWLLTGMLKDTEHNEALAKTIIEELGDHSLNLSHARHLSADKCAEIGLTINNLEENSELQDAVLSVHHAFILTLSSTPAFKIISNHNGISFIQQQQLLVPGMAPGSGQ